MESLSILIKISTYAFPFNGRIILVIQNEHSLEPVVSSAKIEAAVSRIPVFTIALPLFVPFKAI